MSTTPSAETRPASRPIKRPYFAWGIVALAALAVPAFGLLLAFTRFVTRGPSMEPLLPDGAQFIVLRRAIAGDPEPGDVVVVSAPDGIPVAKRVVAVGGQTVELRASVLVVDGRVISEDVECPPGSNENDESRCRRERLGEREWVTIESTYSIPDHLPAFQVPDGHVYVLGDHRDRSNDSRNPTFGPIPMSSVVGTVLGH